MIFKRYQLQIWFRVSHSELLSYKGFLHSMVATATPQLQMIFPVQIDYWQIPVQWQKGTKVTTWVHKQETTFIHFMRPACISHLASVLELCHRLLPIKESFDVWPNQPKWKVTKRNKSKKAKKTQKSEWRWTWLPGSYTWNLPQRHTEQMYNHTAALQYTVFIMSSLKKAVCL